MGIFVHQEDTWLIGQVGVEMVVQSQNLSCFVQTNPLKKMCCQDWFHLPPQIFRIERFSTQKLKPSLRNQQFAGLAIYLLPLNISIIITNIQTKAGSLSSQPQELQYLSGKSLKMIMKKSIIQPIQPKKQHNKKGEKKKL